MSAGSTRRSPRCPQPGSSRVVGSMVQGMRLESVAVEGSSSVAGRNQQQVCSYSVLGVPEAVVAVVVACHFAYSAPDRRLCSPYALRS